MKIRLIGINTIGRDPPGSGSEKGTRGTDAYLAEKPKFVGESYLTGKLSATGNLKQSDLFDDQHPFHDRNITAYFAKFSSELTDDLVPYFFRAKYAYSVFEKLGTEQARRYAWCEIGVLCHLLAKKRGASK